jgi:hypothetical protein
VLLALIVIVAGHAFPPTGGGGGVVGLPLLQAEKTNAAIANPNMFRIRKHCKRTRPSRQVK